MSLSAGFEARRAEACGKIEQIVEEYRDVFGPHRETDDDAEPWTEEDCAGTWAVSAWAVAIGWIRLDEAGDAPMEFVRALSPRNVSYPTRVGLFELALDVAR